MCQFNENRVKTHITVCLVKQRSLSYMFRMVCSSETCLGNKIVEKVQNKMIVRITLRNISINVQILHLKSFLRIQKTGAKLTSTFPWVSMRQNEQKSQKLIKTRHVGRGKNE